MTSDFDTIRNGLRADWRAESALNRVESAAEQAEKALEHLTDNRSSLDRAYGFKEEVERLRRHVSEAEHLAADQSQSADEWQERAERAERRNSWLAMEARVAELKGRGSDRRIVRIKAAEARVAALEMVHGRWCADYPHLMTAYDKAVLPSCSPKESAA